MSWITRVLHSNHCHKRLKPTYTADGIAATITCAISGTRSKQPVGLFVRPRGGSVLWQQCRVLTKYYRVRTEWDAPFLGIDFPRDISNMACNVSDHCSPQVYVPCLFQPRCRRSLAERS